MKNRQNAAGITGLRNFLAAQKLNHRGKKKPEKLRGGQREAGEKGFPGATAREREERPATGARKNRPSMHANGQSEFCGQCQREDQGIAEDGPV